MTKTQAIIYLQGYRYQLTLDEEKIQRIGSDNQASLHLPLLTEADELTIEKQDEWVITHQGQEHVLSLGSPLTLSLSDDQQATVILTPVTKLHVFDLLDKKEIILSTDKGATLELPNDHLAEPLSAI